MRLRIVSSDIATVGKSNTGISLLTRSRFILSAGLQQRCDLKFVSWTVSSTVLGRLRRLVATRSNRY